MTDVQKEWVTIKELIYRLKPKVKITPPEKGFKRICFIIIKWKYFKYFSAAYTFTNGVLTLQEEDNTFCT